MVFLESQAGLEFTGNLFDQCILKRTFEWCATFTIKNGNPSNWCQHQYPWHEKRWSRAFMQRAWNVQLCLECWCCCAFEEGALLLFSGCAWLSFVWWCHCCWHYWHGDDHSLQIRAFMQKAWNLQLCLEHWGCCVLFDAIIVIDANSMGMIMLHGLFVLPFLLWLIVI